MQAPHQLDIDALHAVRRDEEEAEVDQLVVVLLLVVEGGVGALRPLLGQVAPDALLHLSHDEIGARMARDVDLPMHDDGG